MAELADAHVWGACGFHRTGSIPVSRTRKKHLRKQVLFSTKSADGGRNPPAVDEIASRWNPPCGRRCRRIWFHLKPTRIFHLYVLNKNLVLEVMFFAENFDFDKSASIATGQTHYGLNPNPYTSRKSKSKRIHFLLSLLCLFFMNELMLTHHELASPWFLALLHELNCNEYHARRAIHAVYCNSWHVVSIHATLLQFIACYP